MREAKGQSLFIFYEKKRELSKEVETESKGTIFQKRDHTEIEENLMHRN